MLWNIWSAWKWSWEIKTNKICVFVPYLEHINGAYENSLKIMTIVGLQKCTQVTRPTHSHSKIVSHLSCVWATLLFYIFVCSILLTFTSVLFRAILITNFLAYLPSSSNRKSYSEHFSICESIFQHAPSLTNETNCRQPPKIWTPTYCLYGAVAISPATPANTHHYYTPPPASTPFTRAIVPVTVCVCAK